MDTFYLLLFTVIQTAEVGGGTNTKYSLAWFMVACNLANPVLG